MKQVFSSRSEVNQSSVDPLEYLASITNGYILSGILFSAVELKLFDLLNQSPANASELAKALECTHVSGMERLLHALLNMGFLTIDSERRFALTEIAEQYLTVTAASSIVPAIVHHHRHSYIPFYSLSKAVRFGGPQLGFQSNGPNSSDLYKSLTSEVGEYNTFIRAMNLFSAGIGNRMVQLVELSNACQIHDIGGGGGQVSVELLKNLPNAKITLLDRQEAIDYVKRHCASEVENRLRLLEGDIFDFHPHLPQADVVILSAVLGDWDYEKRSKILKHAWAYLRPGGKLIISETLLDDDKCGPANTVFLSIYVLLLTQGGQNYSATEWKYFLEAQGLSDIKIIRDGQNGFRDLIVCTKPNL